MPDSESGHGGSSPSSRAASVAQRLRASVCGAEDGSSILLIRPNLNEGEIMLAEDFHKATLEELCAHRDIVVAEIACRHDRIKTLDVKAIENDIVSVRRVISMEDLHNSHFNVEINIGV